MSFGLDEHDSYGVQKDAVLGGKLPEAHNASIEVLVGLGEGLQMTEGRRRSPDPAEEDDGVQEEAGFPYPRGSARRSRATGRFF